MIMGIPIMPPTFHYSVYFPVEKIIGGVTGGIRDNIRWTVRTITIVCDVHWSPQGVFGMNMKNPVTYKQIPLPQAIWISEKIIGGVTY